MTFVLDIPSVLSSAFRKQLPGLVWGPPLPHAQDKVPKHWPPVEPMSQLAPGTVPWGLHQRWENGWGGGVGGGQHDFAVNAEPEAGILSNRP